MSVLNRTERENWKDKVDWKASKSDWEAAKVDLRGDVAAWGWDGIKRKTGTGKTNRCV